MRRLDVDRISPANLTGQQPCIQQVRLDLIGLDLFIDDLDLLPRLGQFLPRQRDLGRQADRRRAVRLSARSSETCPFMASVYQPAKPKRTTRHGGQPCRSVRYLIFLSARSPQPTFNDHPARRCVTPRPSMEAGMFFIPTQRNTRKIACPPLSGRTGGGQGGGHTLSHYGVWSYVKTDTQMGAGGGHGHAGC